HAPDTPPEIERIISQALQKKREERYQTANELSADLKHLKRQLERQDELKEELARAGQPGGEALVVSGSEVALPEATLKQAESTSDVASAHTTAKHWVSGIRRHKLLAACALVLIVASAGWLYWRGAKLNWAKAAIPRIEEQAKAEQFFEAYDLAVEAQKYL